MPPLFPRLPIKALLCKAIVEGKICQRKEREIERIRKIPMFLVASMFPGSPSVTPPGQRTQLTLTNSSINLFIFYFRVNDLQEAIIDRDLPFNCINVK